MFFFILGSRQFCELFYQFCPLCQFCHTHTHKRPRTRPHTKPHTQPHTGRCILRLTAFVSSCREGQRRPTLSVGEHGHAREGQFRGQRVLFCGKVSGNPNCCWSIQFFSPRGLLCTCLEGQREPPNRCREWDCNPPPPLPPPSSPLPKNIPDNFSG